MIHHLAFYPEAVTSTVPDGAARPGLFVSFEGGDGAGKTTQADLLGAWLGDQGREVVRTREPGGTELGLTLRNLVLHGDHVDARTEALLYATDRAHHVASLIRPALDRGAVVITDRYLDSSLAYQAGGRELGMSELRDLQMWAVGGLLPDMTILLDLDPALLPQRLTGEPDRLERAGEDFHRRTREAYLQLARAEPDRWLVLDASGDVREIQAEIRSALQSRAPGPAGADADADREAS